MTPYQATDEALSYTDDYGAWFNKGGIGGTIQNPLLRLNEDGSIVSRDGSFVIHPDGTGHFASGRFKWGKDTIELRDVTIRWEDLDEEAQELLKPRSVSLTGGTAFHFKDELSGACEPENIPLVATEYNFEPESRQWEYLAVDGIWKDAGCNAAVFEMTPPFHGWEGRDVLTLRYTATYRNEKSVRPIPFSNFTTDLPPILFMWSLKTARHSATESSRRYSVPGCTGAVKRLHRSFPTAISAGYGRAAIRRVTGYGTPHRVTAGR